MAEKSREIRPIQCTRCQIPMHKVAMEEWVSGGGSILLRQLQKIADGAGIWVYHCKSCGKVEFFRWKK